MSVEFVVNDLDAYYEVIGTSDNYSFQYKIGLGSDLVDSAGDAYTKIISLKGNYGTFEVKVFAVSEIGIRSDSVFGSVQVSPPFLTETFKFNNLRFSAINGGVEDSLFIHQSPANGAEDLIVSQQFLGSSVEVSWELTPPVGHYLEGQSLSTDLLSDSMFSGFQVNIKNSGQLVDIGSYSYSNPAIESFADQINTSNQNVAEALQGYRQFSINLDSGVFSGLNLTRDISLEIVSVDNLGRTSTGIMSGYNPLPQIQNFSNNLNGPDSLFSWSVDSEYYQGVDINILGVPEYVELNDSGDLIGSKNFIEKINNTIGSNVSWDYGFKYQSGNMVVENDSVYEAVSGHTGYYNNRPSSSSTLWRNLGNQVDYIYRAERVNSNNFSVQQIFGYKYYYTFQAFDDFGLGDLLFLGDNDILGGGVLSALQSNIKIANLRYRENKDALLFNWDVVDQDENVVDLVKYRTLIKAGGIPSILGLSGSLYDIDSNQILTGITEGFNSNSLRQNSDQGIDVVYNLPTAKIFESFEYTRELNNSLYGSGGFPSSYEVFNSTGNYSSGDHVVDSLRNVYKAILNTSSEDPSIKPFYNTWSKSSNYNSGDSFLYGNLIYKTSQGFGPDYTSGLFDFSKTYSSGDLVISPNQDYEDFDSASGYNLNELVVYDSTLYKSLQFQETGSTSLPGSDEDKWIIASLFSEVDCDIYKAIDSVSGLRPSIQGGGIVDKWEICTPDVFSGTQAYIYNYTGFAFEWSTGLDFITGDLVIYSNDIWSGVQNSGPNEDSGIVVPGQDPQFWQNQSNGQDIIFGYNSGDLVYFNGTVYRADADDPVGIPILAIDGAGEESQSTYAGTEWLPYWQEETQYGDTVFGHVGIPESGKRSVGIELALVDNRGEIFNLKKLGANNPPPYILTEGFSVDSTGEATKVKFNFNYDLGFQEKTTKVYLYRSEDPDFDIVDEEGLPLTGAGSVFVKSVIGAGDATFGQNITQIIDEPPIPQIDGIDQITGYYYKILPFDDFGSGVLYDVNNNLGDLV